MAYAPLPPRGIKVLSGKTGEVLACVTSPLVFSLDDGETIVAQCCTSDGPEGPDSCRRATTGKGDKVCVAGHAKRDGVQPTTYSEAYQLCAERNLRLCGQSCKGTGCGYDRYPVWSRLECDAQPWARRSGV